MPEHSVIADADRHENKGISTAADNTVASSTANVTVWRKVNANMLDTSTVFNTNKAYFTLSLADVSTAEVAYFVVPFTGTLTKVDTILHGAISVADSTVTIKNNSGATAGTITVAFTGSAAGDIDTVSPVANNTFTIGQKLTVETDGASTTAAKFTVVLTFTITG